MCLFLLLLKSFSMFMFSFFVEACLLFLFHFSLFSVSVVLIVFYFKFFYWSLSFVCFIVLFFYLSSILALICLFIYFILIFCMCVFVVGGAVYFVFAICLGFCGFFFLLFPFFLFRLVTRYGLQDLGSQTKSDLGLRDRSTESKTLDHQRIPRTRDY